MKEAYTDIRSRIAEPPEWFDENGTPRYGAHTPDMCPDIYASEVALLLIACQACRVPMKVQMFDPPHASRMADEVRRKEIHYGDPPDHDNDAGIHCHVGCTMNCIDLRVLEYWKREGANPWQRVPELEIEIESIHDY